jgi:hypothetical protein
MGWKRCILSFFHIDTHLWQASIYTSGTVWDEEQ